MAIQVSESNQDTARSSSVITACLRQDAHPIPTPHHTYYLFSQSGFTNVRLVSASISELIMGILMCLKLNLHLPDRAI